MDWMVGVTSSDGGFEVVEAGYDAGMLTLLTPLAPGEYQLNPPQLEPRVLACVGPASCRVGYLYLSPAITFTVPP